MMELEQYFCPNEQCEEYGITHKGNISVRCRYGKDKSRVMLYCRTCGKRFSSAQASVFLDLHLPTDKIRQIIDLTAKGNSVRTISGQLELDKDTVNRVLLRASEHCTNVLSDLLNSLEMSETQLDKFWDFIKRRKILIRRRKPRLGKGE